MTRSSAYDGPPALPPEAWRPAIAPLPDKPLAPWNPVEAGYRRQLLAHVQGAYGPAGEVEAPEFMVDPDGPIVVVLARLTAPYPALLVGTGARPGPLVFSEQHRAPEARALLTYQRRYGAELRAVHGYRDPVPQETAYP